MPASQVVLFLFQFNPGDPLQASFPAFDPVLQLKITGFSLGTINKDID
jgi:hypothetical protein